MKKIVIAGDSTFDLPEELVKKYDIKVMPSYVNLGENCLLDYPDLKSKDLFDFYEQKKQLPKTSAANIFDYEEFFKKYAPKDVDMVFVAKGSKLSSCYQNAVEAAKEFDNVFVVDSKTICCGSGILTVLGAESTNQSAKELKEELDKLADKLDSSFVIETLEYLKMGGRCTAMQLFGANLLKIRPQIVVVDVKMITGKKYRGKYEVVLKEYINEKLNNLEEFDDRYLFVANTLENREVFENCKNLILSKGYFKNVHFVEAGSAISCHCGPNTLGLFLLKK